MSWRLQVLHRTEFHYEDLVHTSYNEARISPLDAPSQFTLEHRVEVSPSAAVFRYRDYWGTRVHAFDLHQPHRTLVVSGYSLVETAARTVRPDPGVSWDSLRAPGIADRFCEYLDATPFTTSDPAVRELATGFASAATPAAAVEATTGWLTDELSYVKGSTDVTTTAVEVLRQRRGVCQDFAHLGIALLRAAGIPARYASGYLFPDAEAPLGETREGQSHAWLEAWVGDWCPIDPTSNETVGERHVVVARGRDYADVPPLKGVYSGGPARRMDVTVELTRVA